MSASDAGTTGLDASVGEVDLNRMLRSLGHRDRRTACEQTDRQGE
jgi:hypothetical protein